MAGPLGWVLAEVEAEKAQLKEEAAREATEAEQAHRAKVRDARRRARTSTAALCHEALRRHGHRLAGSSPARTVERVVEIGGLWPMLSIYPDLRTAQVAFIDE